MDQLLQELFYDEIDQGRLVFEDFPEYNDLMNQSVSLFPDGDLPVSISKLLDTANCISFAHGLRVRQRLERWINL